MRQALDQRVAADVAAGQDQLQIGGNTLSEVLTNVPDSTTVYRYSPATGFGQGATFINGYGWFDNDDSSGTGGPPEGPTLVPGQGAFLLNPASAFDLQLTGSKNIPVLPLANLTCAQYYFLSRQTNGVGTFEFLHQQLKWPDNSKPSAGGRGE